MYENRTINSIIMILLKRELVSATELAKTFEVTTRTIYRDVETLLCKAKRDPHDSEANYFGKISAVSESIIQKGMLPQQI